MYVGHLNHPMGFFAVQPRGSLLKDQISEVSFSPEILSMPLLHSMGAWDDYSVWELSLVLFSFWPSLDHRLKRMCELLLYQIQFFKPIYGKLFLLFLWYWLLSFWILPANSFSFITSAFSFSLCPLHKAPPHDSSIMEYNHVLLCVVLKHTSRARSSQFRTNIYWAPAMKKAVVIVRLQS